MNSKMLKIELNNLSTLLYSVRNRAVMLLLPAVVLMIMLIFGTPAFAAVEGFVSKSSDGSYHQYNYRELLDSYALKVLGKPNGLYEDFAGKSPVAFIDSVNGYIDYSDVLQQYALALLSGQKFFIDNYTESSLAKKAIMPVVMKVVTFAEGTIERVAINISYDLQTDPIEANALQPPTNLSANLGKTPELEKPLTITPLVSAAGVSLSRAQQWAAEKGAHPRFIDTAPLYWKYGLTTGLRPEVLYVQSAYETNFGHFTGVVQPHYNNWAGIKTAVSSGDEPGDHEQFATPEDGVRAHFNHMAAYTGLKPIGEPHDRYYLVLRLSWAGTVVMVEELSGKWAPSPAYHERILSLLDEIR